MAPSNIGLVHRPLKAERWVRLPLELKQNLSEKRSNALDFRAERTPARRLFFLDNNIAVSVKRKGALFGGVHIQGCSPLEQSVTLTLRPSANDFIASNMPF